MNARALVLLALLLPAVAATQPHVSQVLSKRQAKLGEPITLDVTVTHPKGQKWALEVPTDLGPFSVLGLTQATTDDHGQQDTRFTLTLGLYEPGKHLVPAMSLKEQQTGVTLPLQQDAEVDAVSTLAKDDPHQLRDVAPPRPLLFTDPKKLVAAAGAVLVALAMAVLLARALTRLWRRLHPPESEEARDRRLLGELAKLEDGPFFDTVDGILRRSLARWHGVPAVERTSEEIVRAVSAKPPPGVTPGELAGVLREALLVRFARRSTSEVHRREALDVCTRLFPQPKEERHGRPALS